MVLERLSITWWVLAAVAMQLLIIGSIGVIFCSTSLLGGLVSSLLVPVQQVFAVLFLHERFNADKGMALAMCLWGFASYFYGEYRSTYKKIPSKQESEVEIIWIYNISCDSKFKSIQHRIHLSMLLLQFRYITLLISHFSSYVIIDVAPRRHFRVSKFPPVQ